MALIITFAILPANAWTPEFSIPNISLPLDPFNIISNYEDTIDFEKFTKDYLFENETIVLNNDFIISKRDVVTLENATLLFNCPEDGRYRIIVKGGGYLVINNSTISSLDKEHAYIFNVEKNGKLLMKNSSINNCGYADPDIKKNGLWMSSNGIALTGNNISGNHYGLIYEDCGFNVLMDNKISSNVAGIKINSSNNNVFLENDISNNVLFGINITRSSFNNVIKNNTLSKNGDGMIIDGARVNIINENKFLGNEGNAIHLNDSSQNVIDKNTVIENNNGIMLASSNTNSLFNNYICYNKNDGIFLDNCKTNSIKSNNASFNGGYGFNITGSNKITKINESNVAYGNLKGDFNIDYGALDIVEISILSILIAFVDKIIYMVDVQKFIISNIFGGIASPVRNPLTDFFEKLTHRAYGFFGIKRKEYRNSHVSSRFNMTFLHFLEDKEAKSVVFFKNYKKVLSNDLVLPQVRFCDLLMTDRVFMFRNAAYFALMTVLGIGIYYLQVMAGTYSLPYFLPIAIQFSIMFIIGIVVQNNIVGRIDRVRYGLVPENDINSLKDAVINKKSALELEYSVNSRKKAKIGSELKKMEEILENIDYMDAKKHYLTFTESGYKKSIEEFNKLLEKDPDNPLFLAGLSEAYSMLGLFNKAYYRDGSKFIDEAVMSAEKAYALNENLGVVRRALGKALYAKGDLVGSEKHIKEAILKNPRDSESYYILAKFKGDIEEQTKLYEKAAGINPDLIIVKRELGLALIRQDKLDRAMNMLDDILKVNNADPFAHKYIGDIYHKKSKYAEAAAEYRKALEAFPGYEEARQSLKEMESN
jgi:parallel beta-helix repeat protein